MLSEKVQNVLINNDLGEYIQLFEEHKLDRIEILKDMTEKDYENIGVIAIGDRKRLVNLFSLQEPNDELKVNVPVNVVVQETKNESGGGSGVI